jgi:hypothetical protein
MLVQVSFQHVRLELRSSANSSKVLTPQIPLAYSYQHSDYTHTQKAVTLLKPRKQVLPG